MDLGTRLEILAGGARYDASCASSGSDRSSSRGLGASVPAGVCHSFTGDGRCVSLLKLLYSNVCRYDCAYCLNRFSNDLPRVSFSVEEIVRLTISFYARNYIEGLFLSSGVFSDPDIVQDKLTEVARILREREGFGGYIHLKAIPGAGEAALRRAGLYADRLSANIELPTRASLAALAPQKSSREIVGAMRFIGESEAENREDRRRLKSAPLFAPAGQSTQIIVGASPDDDASLLGLSELLYSRYRLRRVYYSAYIPVSGGAGLPGTAPPLLREHRLYQADWLLRFYGFRAAELADSTGSLLPADIDPKTAWALAHPGFFPIELMTADYAAILRVPGIGVTGAQRILGARRTGRLRAEDLSRIGIVMKRARHFISLAGRRLAEESTPETLRVLLADKPPAALRPGQQEALASQSLAAKASASKRPLQPGLSGLPAPGGLPLPDTRPRQTGALGAAQLEFDFFSEAS